MLTFQQLRKALSERGEGYAGIYDWSPTDWGCAAAGEMGELCNLLKKMRRGQYINIKDVAYEIADTVMYLDLLAARLGISLDEAIIEKFNIVSERLGLKNRLVDKEWEFTMECVEKARKTASEKVDKLREVLEIVAGTPDKDGHTHLSTLHDVGAIGRYAKEKLKEIFSE